MLHSPISAFVEYKPKKSYPEHNDEFYKEILHIVPAKIPMYVKYADRDNLYGLDQWRQQMFLITINKLLDLLVSMKFGEFYKQTSKSSHKNIVTSLLVFLRHSSISL